MVGDVKPSKMVALRQDEALATHQETVNGRDRLSCGCRRNITSPFGCLRYPERALFRPMIGGQKMLNRLRND